MKYSRDKQEVLTLLKELKDQGFILSEYSAIVERTKKKYERYDALYGESIPSFPSGKIGPDMIESEDIMTLIGILSDQVNWLYDRISTEA